MLIRGPNLMCHYWVPGKMVTGHHEVIFMNRVCQEMVSQSTGCWTSVPYLVYEVGELLIP